MDGKIWPAHEGDCYFPVDFERSPSTVEIARWPANGNIQTGWLRVVERDFGEQNIDYPDDSLVNVSNEDLQRLYSEQAKIKPIFRTRGPAKFSLPLAEPASPLPEGRFFGIRRTFNGVPKNAHTGVDYAIGLDNSVKSVAAGKVVLVHELLFAGKSVFVDHGNGMVSMYFHLNSASVEPGDEVERGGEVGKVGSTGRSTGPHLHLGLRWRGARIDPSVLMGDFESLPAVSVAARE